MASLEDLVKQLQKELATVKAERDDLEKDVENLCMQNGNASIFSRSAVLSERIYSTDKELSKAKKQLETVTAERDSLREDLLSTKESKRKTDGTWKAEREKVERLEKELSFYQTQSVRAIADRDKAAWEAEELRNSTLAMEARLRIAESKALSETTKRAETDRQLAAAQTRVQELEELASEAASVPGLRDDLAKAESLIKDLTELRNSLQVELSHAIEEVSSTKTSLLEADLKLQDLAKDYDALQKSSSIEGADLQKEKETLEGMVKELKQTKQRLETRLEEAEGALAGAQAEVEVTRQTAAKQAESQAAAAEERETKLVERHNSTVKKLESELEQLQADHKNLQQEFEQANKEKVQALMRLSAAEQTATQAFEEMGEMKDQVADLKESLKKATEEKVSALMQLAGGRKTSGKGKSGAAAAPSSSWRRWGAGGGEEPDGPGSRRTTTEA
eukprot:jgi/Botrbrau1/2841/Bobra.0125s0048.3